MWSVWKWKWKSKIDCLNGSLSLGRHFFEDGGPSLEAVRSGGGIFWWVDSHEMKQVCFYGEKKHFPLRLACFHGKIPPGTLKKRFNILTLFSISWPPPPDTLDNSIRKRQRVNPFTCFNRSAVFPDRVQRKISYFFNLRLLFLSISPLISFLIFHPFDRSDLQACLAWSNNEETRWGNGGSNGGSKGRSNVWSNRKKFRRCNRSGLIQKSLRACSVAFPHLANRF